jgi:hypothetical protein
MLWTGKLLILIGLALVALGLLLWGLGRLGFRGLPGDIRYESPHVRVYFPIVTCLLLSLLMTGLLWLWHWLTRR